VLELRTVLIMVPPLLADLLRRAASFRAENTGVALSIIADLDDPHDLDERLALLMPDLLIFGPAAAARAPHTRLPPGTRKLTLSPDLAQILGPADGETAALTPEILAERLRRIAGSI
jgi:hypothetical protein